MKRIVSSYCVASIAIDRTTNKIGQIVMEQTSALWLVANSSKRLLCRYEAIDLGSVPIRRRCLGEDHSSICPDSKNNAQCSRSMEWFECCSRLFLSCQYLYPSRRIQIAPNPPTIQYAHSGIINLPSVFVMRVRSTCLGLGGFRGLLRL